MPAAQGQVGRGRYCCTGSQATPVPPQRLSIKQPSTCAAGHPGTQALVPVEAPTPPAQSLKLPSSPLLPSVQSTWLSGDALHRTRLAPCIYLTAKYSCFSLFVLTGCKFASGWQLQAGTAWEEPQGQLQAWFCQATEGCPVPLRLAKAVGGLCSDQAPSLGKPLPKRDAGNPQIPTRSLAFC